MPSCLPAASLAAALAGVGSGCEVRAVRLLPRSTRSDQVQDGPGASQFGNQLGRLFWGLAGIGRSAKLAGPAEQIRSFVGSVRGAPSA